MKTPSENESWLMSAGGKALEKKTRRGIKRLTDREHLLYCLWVVDYCMRNAGDLMQVDLLYENCLAEGKRLAKSLSLPFAEQSFSLSRDKLEAEYEARFERLCSEVRRIQ